ncbi:hypothetical protein ScPMuIL_009120 [Solemya velum]
MAETSKNICHPLSKSFKNRLDNLGCPYTEGVEDSWISELIFKPGEPRIRLLQWLFSRFDSQLNEVLDPQYASVESKMDSRIQRLLFVASTLGLCKYDDVDLIRGLSSSSKQAVFMDQLMDLVCIMDSADDPRIKALQSPGIISEATGLEDQFHKDCTYVDTLVDQEKLDNLFNPQISLLPPDLQRQIEVSWVAKGYSKEKPPKPDLNELLDSATRLALDVQKQLEILEHLKKNFKYQEADDAKSEMVMRTLQLGLSELSQLVVGFSYCYENEMCHWCNKTPPILTQLGQAFKRVHTLFQQFSQLLKDFQSIRASYTSLSRDATDRICKFTMDKRAKGLASDSQIVMERLQECVSVLDESISRQEADQSHPTASSSFHSFSLRV